MPPVARPLGGNWSKGVTLTEPGSLPAAAGEEAAIVTTDELWLGAAPKKTTGSLALIPATPPPERPCGRTAEAGK